MRAGKRVACEVEERRIAAGGAAWGYFPAACDPETRLQSPIPRFLASDDDPDSARC